MTIRSGFFLKWFKPALRVRPKTRSIKPSGLSIRWLHAREPIHHDVDNLADLFARSPFHGLNMDFERDKDAGRDINL
jgi:hypothetical protein